MAVAFRMVVNHVVVFEHVDEEQPHDEREHEHGDPPIASATDCHVYGDYSHHLAEGDNRDETASLGEVLEARGFAAKRPRLREHAGACHASRPRCGDACLGWKQRGCHGENKLNREHGYRGIQDALILSIEAAFPQTLREAMDDEVGGYKRPRDGERDGSALPA